MAATMMSTKMVTGVHAPSCTCASCGIRKSATPLTATPLRTRRVSKVRASASVLQMLPRVFDHEPSPNPLQMGC